jgi:hypothetical protein
MGIGEEIRFHFYDNFSLGPDLDRIYEKYEEFYQASTVGNIRDCRKNEAAEEFTRSVVEEFNVREEEFNFGGMLGIMMSMEEDDLLEEKMSKKEFYDYLTSQIK